MRYAPIVPAVIPKSEQEVKEFAKRLNFSQEFHLDLVDGNFVKATSWPFSPLGDALSVKFALDVYTLEVDLMVAEPIKVATQWVIAGADMLVFHTETIELEVFKNFAEGTFVSVGISSHGDTSLETLVEYAQYADYIQLMGIYEIGSQGQPFDEAVLDKIAELKRIFPDKSITIDGSVNKDTIKKLYDAGADRFITGSAVVLQDDPQAAHTHLLSLING